MKKLKTVVCIVTVACALTLARSGQQWSVGSAESSRLVRVVANGESLENSTDDSTEITDYFYDTAGRLIREQTTAQVGHQKTILTESTYQYDQSGILRARHVSIQSAYVEFESHYDRYGHLMDSYVPFSTIASIAGLMGNHIRCEYDAEGNLMRATAGGVVYTYEYDSSGRIMRVKNTDQHTADISFSYQPEGRYTIRWDFNDKTGEGNSGIVYDQELNNQGKIIHSREMDSQTEEVFEDLQYTYDAEGNLIRLYGKDRWRNEPSVLLSRGYIYEYDSNGNMTSAYEFYADDNGKIKPEMNAIMARYYYYEEMISSSQSRPSEADLDAINANIRYPRRAEFYLDHYINTEVTARKCMVFLDPNSSDVMADSNHFDVRRGERVTILAESQGYACVILPNLGKAGWINYDYLAEH